MNLREFIQTEIKLQLDESVNESYTGNPGDKLTHKYDKRVEIELIEPTNRGWKVQVTTNGKKPKIAYFDKQDIVGDKSLFESVNEETVYIDYLNKNKGFKQDRKYFKGKNAYDDAVKWAKKNFEKFNLDMINFESVNEGIWPKSKLSDRFEFILSDELKKNFKGIFYVVGYDLYHNDKKVMTINPDKDSVNSIIKSLKSKLKESVNESEQLDEKLITFSNRAPYGQVVFMAGGAGSGKGFAIDNFIDAAGFKVRDVDEMKKALGKLDALGKVSVDRWFKQYGKKLSTKPPKNNPKGMSEREHIEEFVLGKGMTISDIASDLKNPNNVASLHYIVDSMGLKDKWLINMLKGKQNKETLPNLLFDITAKKVASITEVIDPLIQAGYNPKNIHLIWVLTNYYTAVEANKERDRVVPDDILLQTHEGAAKTMWEVLTQIKPKGLEGRIDVILNNREHTAFFVDKNGDKIKVEPSQQNKLKDAEPVVKGFKSLPIKKQGGGIVPEKVWKDILRDWILNNVPKTISITQDVMRTSKDK